MTTGDVDPADTFRIERDDRYLQDLEAEAAFWDDPPFNPFDQPPAILERHLNECFTGDARLPWYATFPHYGDFQRGCALGVGWLDHDREILAMNPRLHVTFMDISPDSLAERTNVLGREFPGRIDTKLADLNFIELPENAYDLIFSDGCLHHVTNIEHVAAQINRALTADGYFFLSDYVGEARFQYTPEKKQFFEATLETLRGRHPFLRYWQPAWAKTDAWEQFSPFEAIRSEDTLATFRHYLDEVLVRSAGAVFFHLLWLRPTDQPAPAPPLGVLARLRRFAMRRLGRSRERITDLMELVEIVGPDVTELDRAVTASGRFLPNNAFAVYRKRAATVDAS